ncbi:Gfo/Idh/MocA family protein [Desulfoluna spongiiphila]|uniref:Predicted dehydrogenase n=1 Tax=Desulfoluna spongiiphila TaxID=419481 RepID=A0A1G5DAJ4_9BACT|nr:Gfo/Idh/MocA family oxidoreductase [Desulfoluna spongiiphila]SCY11773.1 Predicted dehydrogenase [Desulfoluna spongiiphila]
MKAGVIGVGKLGKIHARIYAELDAFELVGVTDPRHPGQEHLHGSAWTRDCSELLALGVEAVTIATPTVNHHEVAKFFLDHGVHCLIEKPIAVTMAEAEDLLETASRKQAFLMVGMVERFNKAYTEARKMITAPMFIESHRLGPFPNRSLDVSVVLDLMIHDLDIILDLVGDEVASVEGVGVKALTDKADIANARIHFKGGCIANITASRISEEQMRRTRVFFNHNYISLDFAEHTIKAFKSGDHGIEKRVIAIEMEEPLKREIRHFHAGITAERRDYTLAKNAVMALDLALKIDEDLAKRQTQLRNPAQ